MVNETRVTRHLDTYGPQNQRCGLDLMCLGDQSYAPLKETAGGRVTARGQKFCWPCGAKKPTRHPLRRPSSAELFGAIAKINPSSSLPHSSQQTILNAITYLSRPVPSTPRGITALNGVTGFFAPQVILKPS